LWDYIFYIILVVSWTLSLSPSQTGLSLLRVSIRSLLCSEGKDSRNKGLFGLKDSQSNFREITLGTFLVVVN
jgi:hypothetical protein